MKSIVYVFLIFGSLVGAAIGTNIDDGNMFGIWSILFAGIGGILGIWIGYTINNKYF